MKSYNSKYSLQAKLFGLSAILALMLMPVGFDHGSQSLIRGNSALASEDGGHDSGGHTSGGHSSGGHSSDSHSSGGHSSGGKGAASSKGQGKGNPAAGQFGGGRDVDPDAERGVGYHGGTSLESRVLRGSSAKGKGGPGGRGGKPEGAGGEDDHDDTTHDDTTHDDSTHDDSSGSKGRKPDNAGKPAGVGGEDDHDH